MYIKLMAVLVVGLVAGGASPTASAQGRSGGVISCASYDNRYTRCPVDWRDAELVRQESDVRCVRDRNWGIDRGAIWVDRGCRGQFAATRGWGGHGYGNARRTVVKCESYDNRYQLCPVRLRRDSEVRLVNNDSDVRCREGYNWGVNRDGIWVNRGCRGRFMVSQR
jgi:hypothetical protein